MRGFGRSGIERQWAYCWFKTRWPWWGMDTIAGSFRSLWNNPNYPVGKTSEHPGGNQKHSQLHGNKPFPLRQGTHGFCPLHGVSAYQVGRWYTVQIKQKALMCTIFLKFYFIYSWETQKEAETQAEGEAGSLRGARCRTWFQDPGIMTWAKGRCSTTEPPRCPSILWFLVYGWWVLIMVAWGRYIVWRNKFPGVF